MDRLYAAYTVHKGKDFELILTVGETGAQWNTGHSGTFRVTYLFSCVQLRIFVLCFLLLDILCRL